MRDLVYCRFSSEQQRGNSSLATQIEVCKNSIKAEGRDPQKAIIFQDEAKSGRQIAGRDALIRMIDQAESGDVIWIFKYDRLARNVSQAATMVEELEEAGVTVRSCTESSDLLARSIYFAMAEAYSNQLSERVRLAKRKKFEEHEYCGGFVPYGYMVVPDNGKRLMKVNDDEAEVVRWIFDEYVNKNVGVKAIRNKLIRRGISPKRGGKWAWTSIRGILRNQQYVGNRYASRFLVKKNKQTGRTTSILRDKSQWQNYHDENLRIISDETFRKAGVKIDERRRPDLKGLNRGQIQYFTGILQCSCGALMYRHAHYIRKDGGGPVYLHCGNRHRTGQEFANCNNTTRFREDYLLQAILGTLKSVIDNADSLMADAFKLAQQKVKSNRTDSQRIKAELATIDTKSKRLVKNLADEDFAPPAKAAISRELTELETRREELNKSLAVLAEDSNNNTEKLMAAIKAAVARAKEGITNVASPESINALLRELVGIMVVGEDGQITPKELPAGTKWVTSSTGAASTVRPAACTPPARPSPRRRSGACSSSAAGRGGRRTPGRSRAARRRSPGSAPRPPSSSPG